MLKKRCSTIFLILLLACSVFFIVTANFGKAQSGTQVSGIIISDTTWTKANSPYGLTGAVAVNTGATLTIQPGVVVNLNNYYIQVNGTLTAIGTSTDKIQFNDGTITFTVLSQGWNAQTGIGSIIQYATVNYSNYSRSGFTESLVEVNSQAKIDHNILYGDFYLSRLISAKAGTISSNLLIAEYSITGVYCKENAVVIDNKIVGAIRGIEVDSGAPSIKRNLIIDSSTCGISITNIGRSSTTPLIQDNSIVKNKNGIEIFKWPAQSTINPTILNNSIYGSLNYNVYLASSLHQLPMSENVNVANNWWGTTDSKAIGQKIYDFTKDFKLGNATFIPFLSQPSTNAPSEDYTPFPTPTPTPSPTLTPTPASSPTPTATPIQPTPSPSQSANQSGFNIFSNSTISAFSINSTAPEVNFIVSGPTGTSGYVKITIAKSFMPNSDIKVYLDENQIEYQLEEKEDAWAITFTYQHSDHQVAIRSTANMEVNSAFPEWVWQAAIIAIIASLTSAACLLLWLAKRKN